MKGLVVGAGSIGSRHLRNLRGHGVDELGLVEPELARRKAIAAEFPVAGFAELGAGLAWNPSLVVVATPSHLHAAQTLEIVRGGFAVFVEKPLSHTAEYVSEIADLVEQKRLTSLVGCNMRFHPGPAKVKQLLEDGRLGKIYFARIHAGSYLPDWRPSSDYRTNYAARIATGGGCILDCIHEIDLARWYLGDVESVFCSAAHLSSLDIETEDVALLVCRHSSGAMSEIHLDYVQRTYERGCQIVGDLGSIFWDFNLRTVRWYDATKKEWSVFTQPVEWEINQMYVDEMKHFLECLQEHRSTTLPIPEAVAVMRIVFAAKASSELEKMVMVGGAAE